MFYDASQEIRETLSEFIVRLKSLSQTCIFSDLFDGQAAQIYNKFIEFFVQRR